MLWTVEITLLSDDDDDVVSGREDQEEEEFSVRDVSCGSQLLVG